MYCGEGRGEGRGEGGHEGGEGNGRGEEGRERDRRERQNCQKLNSEQQSITMCNHVSFCRHDLTGRLQSPVYL